MIERTAAKAFLKACAKFPVAAVTGPRQSGKTTLCQNLFTDRPYVSFEDPDVSARFEADPRGFLKRYGSGAVFDEAQRQPSLFSYLQSMVDTSRRMGRFVLTGSSQFHLFSNITQSLAGRLITLELLPFSLRELTTSTHLSHLAKLSEPSDLAKPARMRHTFENPTALDEIMFRGLYPPIHDRDLPPRLWLSNYVRGYVERDVRALIQVKDLSCFQRFLRLCAARTGALVNLSELGSATGVSHNTIKSWMSVLEASYIVFLLRPLHTNLSKRLVKTPKLYFYDTGLLCWLLGIQSADQLNIHPMRGAVFESFVISEMLKHRTNALLGNDNFFFFRDRSGNEIDLIIDQGLTTTAIEIKSSATYQNRFTKQLRRWSKLVTSAEDGRAKSNQIDKSKPREILIYGGDESFEAQGCLIKSWRHLAEPDPLKHGPPSGPATW